ncbi:SRS domain-containing protein [Neospora caninum Liverpool]|uniref:SRS domain-containing protein n=1 Tax=Neospora caninum (strain Liverpool) TaxID=572307 RepID=F0VJ84_NEOCL|nr:SRS domain-containing protein [Neospora caninum Liverpool]CBZ53795.1 SRS domain-containing protein [Neospora caninum Liverpool]CEL67788.1 TPA: SRS domain-containing protein [Neospora caninum Liverpool]|eukprot:XP_003883827.1 SRS domain-containing protein [Neospora caninum Liverpool]
MNFCKISCRAPLALKAVAGVFVLVNYALMSNASEMAAPIQCASGETKEIQAPTSGSIVFQCGANLQLTPTDGAVFQGEECTEQTKLDSLVPGANLVTKAQKSKSASPTYTLTFDDTPPEAQVLCYKCVAPTADAGGSGRSEAQGGAEQAQKECKLIINVPGVEGLVTSSGSVSASLTRKCLAAVLAGLLIALP